VEGVVRVSGGLGSNAGQGLLPHDGILHGRANQLGRQFGLLAAVEGDVVAIELEPILIHFGIAEHTAVRIRIFHRHFAGAKPGVIDPELLQIVVIGHHEQVMAIPAQPAKFAGRVDTDFDNDRDVVGQQAANGVQVAVGPVNGLDAVGLLDVGGHFGRGDIAVFGIGFEESGRLALGDVNGQSS
jgi:hypothetical protein